MIERWDPDAETGWPEPDTSDAVFPPTGLETEEDPTVTDTQEEEPGILPADMPGAGDAARATIPFADKHGNVTVRKVTPGEVDRLLGPITEGGSM